MTARTRTLNPVRILLTVVVLPVLLGGATAWCQEGADAPQSVAAGEHRVPKGWSLETDADPEVLSVGVVSDVVREGGSSVRISHSRLASSTLISRPVQLQVGRLYRLSGWIKADGVHSDPTSRYPTAVPACLSMASFPFTNHSPTVGGDRDWTMVEVLFIATSSSDRIRLHLGYNGGAAGTAWFDDVELEPAEQIDDYLPAETVSWFGDAYRYDDRGWIFAHIEGEPYQRGYQHGVLLADEIVAYMSKLSYQRNEDDPQAGWQELRFLTDTLLLRKYDEEYLTEMRGIADGANHAEAEIHGRELDLLDIVTINSITDLFSLKRAIAVTPHSLTGQGFLDDEEELLIAEDEHHCSAFAATAPATRDGRVVFGQIFMWSGYTGVHWNVILDLQPSEGHRLVYQTFPGGIHSGADFFINDAGIIIGETTVQQSPFDIDGTPQSNRIRKAAQYAASIDEVSEILWQGNNGMYTNDWPIADIKSNEVAILLLGTKSKKLWRSSDQPAPFGTPGFLWANNNNRDPEVRKEYLAQPHDAPFDLVFSPWNRDIAFNEFYQEHHGDIDTKRAVELWASSPINRAHACDGKLTTSEMAAQLVFLAHYGKVTLREKVPVTSGRLISDLPGAIPHLSLGYSTPSPLFLGDKLQQRRRKSLAEPVGQDQDHVDSEDDKELDLDAVADRYELDRRRLWRDTVFPASEAEGWFISGTASYWHLLHTMALTTEEKGVQDSAEQLSDLLAAMTSRYQYLVSREQDLVPLETSCAYDRYGPYRIPRIKGSFALHQLRLLLGNERFLEVMRSLHERFHHQDVSTAQLIATAEKVAGEPLDRFLRQWIERSGLPRLQIAATSTEAEDGGWDIALSVHQEGEPYHLLSSVEIETDSARLVRPIEIDGTSTAITLHLDDEPQRLRLDPLHDLPLATEQYYTWRNLIDDFHHLLIVYGTSRQIEANHTIALDWQTRMADAYIEIMPPVVKDSEITSADLASHDLMVLGHPSDNSLVASMAGELPLSFAKNLFRWQGKTYADPDDGLYLVLPNPHNPERVLYLVIANSALQLYRMTRHYQIGLPSWVLWKGEEQIEEGYHEPAGVEIEL